MLDRLGNPEEAFRALHVTGSNGKGSACAFLDACLRSAGHRVGLYTSPHLVTFRERIRIGGEPISPDDVARGVERIRPIAEDMDGRRSPPTYFECVTALAFAQFRDARVPLVVAEVGLGGRLDATNVVRSLVSVVTNVHLEHTDRLGPSVQSIAAEKAGILHGGVPAVTAARREALDVLAREATKRKAPLRVVRRPDPVEESLDGTAFRFPYLGEVRAFRTRLLGEHQAENAAVALAALEAVQKDVSVDAGAAERGVACAEWPGRLEVVRRDPLGLLDGAHNADAIEALGGFLGRRFGGQQVAACVGVLREKNATKMLATLSAHVSRFVLTRAPNERALAPEELLHALPRDAPSAVAVEDPAEALRVLFQQGDEPVKLITGSLFLVGAARAQLLRLERDPDVAVPPAQ